MQMLIDGLDMSMFLKGYSVENKTRELLSRFLLDKVILITIPCCKGNCFHFNFWENHWVGDSFF